jgi:hypothetical protein
VDLREGFVTVRNHQECYGIYEAEVKITDAQICADVPEGGVGTCGVSFNKTTINLLTVLN